MLQVVVVGTTERIFGSSSAAGTRKYRFGDSRFIHAQHVSTVAPSTPSYSLDEERLTCNISNVLVRYLLGPMDAEEST